MNHPSRRAAFSLFAALIAASCGGSAFTAGESSDGGMMASDATTEASVEAGEGGALDTGVDSGVVAETGVDAGVDTGSAMHDGAANDAGCHIGSDCSTGYCSKAGMCEPCTTTGECGTNQWCDTLAGACKPTKPNGATCAGSAECQSEFCVDGVCATRAAATTARRATRRTRPGRALPSLPAATFPLAPALRERSAASAAAPPAARAPRFHQHDPELRHVRQGVHRRGERVPDAGVHGRHVHGPLRQHRVGLRRRGQLQRRRPVPVRRQRKARRATSRASR